MILRQWPNGYHLPHSRDLVVRGRPEGVEVLEVAVYLSALADALREGEVREVAERFALLRARESQVSKAYAVLYADPDLWPRLDGCSGWAARRS